MNKHIPKIALLHAAATAVYIVILVSLIIFTGPIANAKMAGKNSIFGPIIMLLLLVISAGTTGFAVFGRPVMWYIDGKKKEAVMLIVWTLGFLALIALLLAILFLIV